MPVLTDWFARKNVDEMVIFVTIFITGMNQVCLITDNIQNQLSVLYFQLSGTFK